jgi:hypothetical protein
MPRLLLLVLLLASPTAALHAQQDAAAAPSTDTPYVLHVYQNLIQIPTLVLTQAIEIPPPVPAVKFRLSIDGGPKFRPTQMHLEGDDPVNLAILLDATGDQNELLKHFEQALASMTPGVLHHEDHVSVFAYDCNLFRSSYDVPADHPLTGSAISRVLATPKLHGETPHHSCKEISLWDSVMRVVSTMGPLSGRKVMLIVSDGHSRKGDYSFHDASEFADTHAVAIFGMRDQDHYRAQQVLGASSRQAGIPLSLMNASDEDLFDALCQKTGGILTTVSRRDLTAALQKFVAMLRNRYILEFPRPDEDRPGRHLVEVTIAGSNDYIRPAGLTIPTAPTRDPNTLAPTASPATYGKHHPVDPSH